MNTHSHTYTLYSPLPERIRKLGYTARSWKSRKRREFAAVMKALDAYRIGCAYTPSIQLDREVSNDAYPCIGNLDRMAREIQKSLSVKAWGR